MTVGIMISMQFGATLHSSNYVSIKQWSEQTTLMEDLQKQNTELSNQVIVLRNRLAATADSSDESKVLNEKLVKANSTAGFTTVTGPGIVISLDDNPNPLTANSNPNDFLVHDYDLLYIVNQLRGSGTEAISINETRVIGSSEIRCAGPTILINTVKVTPPFEIKAIGDPETLDKSMRAENGDLQILAARGIRISIQKAGKITIPAFNGILQYQYAKPNMQTALTPITD
jgi:uncharacterized protein YlxW (UPF0749 family)